MRWILVVALVACGGRPSTPSAAPPAPARIDAAIAVRPAPLSEASIVADVAWLTAPERRGRGSLSPDARGVARWIEHELVAAGYTPMIQPIKNAPEQVNVIAVHAGSGAGPSVLVTAHYDHLGAVDGVVHTGADDNASGVAVALAAARDVVGADLEGEVVFVFTGAEEIGLYGAIAYADAPVRPLADVRLAINLDMVGRRLFESAIDRDGALGAIGLDGEFVAVAEAAASVAELELLTATPTMVRWIGQDWRSDDWVFRDRGVRAVHLSTGLHDDYHQRTDTVDKLSRPQLVRIARFLRELVGAVAR
jgi:hypothetical protein